MENEKAPMSGRRKLIWGLGIGAAVILLLIGISVAGNLLTQDSGENRDPRIPETAATEAIRFEDPDPDYNIFEDEEWLDEDRYIHYSNGIEGTVITRDHNEQEEIGLLFLDYFESLEQGNHNKYNGLLTASYREGDGGKDYFTMQRVYNISVTLTQSYTFTEGPYAGMTRILFRVEYAIMKNDGTFRDDLPSDKSCPMTFEVLSDGTQVKINGIERVIVGQY